MKWNVRRLFIMAIAGALVLPRVAPTVRAGSDGSRRHAAGRELRDQERRRQARRRYQADDVRVDPRRAHEELLDILAPERPRQRTDSRRVRCRLAHHDAGLAVGAFQILRARCEPNSR